MDSLKELYKIGNGPSSSHTMGPKNAALYINQKYKDADYIKVILYGSLALTGKGHLTDKTIKDTLIAKSDIEFDYLSFQTHPNTLMFEIYKNNNLIDKVTVISIGGGSIEIEGVSKRIEEKDIYPHKTLKCIIDYCKKENLSLADYVYKYDESDIKDYLKTVYHTMLKSIDNGLAKDGLLPGKLKISRKAKSLFEKEDNNETLYESYLRKLYSFAYAVSEENASGGIIVTAPTCGSSGIVPAGLNFAKTFENIDESKLIDGLAVAGLFGNIAKYNGSIAGAEAGCQAEVGVACAMAAAFYAYIHNLDIDKIGQSAEIALEHHLGLTCDPILGYVQIPCIERNAVASIRAIDAVNLAKLLDSTQNRISFDQIVKTMYETGKDLTSNYRETSLGGLAKLYEGDNPDE